MILTAIKVDKIWIEAFQKEKSDNQEQLIAIKLKSVI